MMKKGDVEKINAYAFQKFIEDESPLSSIWCCKMFDFFVYVKKHRAWLKREFNIDRKE